jgi:acylphosphatase
MVRKQLQFYGRVQGVGFRYHATHAARGLGLTGWVRNEYDGSVMMEVQGPEELIDRMILTLQQDSYINILQIEVKDLPVREDEYGFGVDY